MSQPPHTASTPIPQPGLEQPERPLKPADSANPGTRRTVGLVTATALIAGSIGALGAFLTVGGNAEQSDTAFVCNKVESLGMPLSRDDFKVDEPVIHELIGISSFAIAAALGNPSQHDLQEPGESLLQGVQRADIELVNEALTQISDVCENIDD